MPFNATVYEILIASPGDVKEERNIVSDIIEQWTTRNSAEYNSAFIPIKWETNVFPDIKLGGRAQGTVNEQIVDRCDALMGIFWTKLGTPTGVEESGTVEEIKRFMEAGKLVMLYFSSRPIVPESIDHKQFKKLQAFRKECEGLGIIESYESPEELAQKVDQHLTLWTRKAKQEGRLIPQMQAQEIDVSSVKARRANLLLDQMESFARRARAEWLTEQDSNSSNLDVARTLTGQLVSAMTEYYGALSEFFGDDDLKEFRHGIRVTKETREGLRHITLDFSFEKMWEFGIVVATDIQALVKQLREKLAQNKDNV